MGFILNLVHDVIENRYDLLLIESKLNYHKSHGSVVIKYVSKNIVYSKLVLQLRIIGHENEICWSQYKIWLVYKYDQRIHKRIYEQQD